MSLKAIAGAVSFAHLLGRATRPAAEVEDDDDKKEKDAKRRAEGDEKDPEDKDDKDAKRAEGEEKDPEDDDKDKKDAKGKKAVGDDGEGDDDDGDDESDDSEMRSKGARSARLHERARCAAIFTDPAAGRNQELAATLAFKTNLPRGQAIAVLRSGGSAAAPAAPKRASLDERMSRVKTPVVGNSDAAATSKAPSVAAQIIEAGRRRRGEI
jgi:hypothetical protein